MPHPPAFPSHTPDCVELVGISADFTPIEVEGLVRTAVDALYGNWADLSERQHELAERARVLIAAEGEDDDEPDQRDDTDSVVGEQVSAYARMLAARERLNEESAAAESAFTALLRRLFPEAAHMVLAITEDSVALRRAISADGSTLRTFYDVGQLPAVPEDVARAWLPHDLTNETALDHIVQELHEAGVVFGSLPEELRDLDEDDRYAYLPYIDLGEPR
ncbi:hypothetical protein ACODT5_02820 [Streptomyces sp. 5.8]|uniref:hypothetical protein n=1 Tax=Streptomyces sp. 5.8 TaxID=3406571 RepID=UPI003BB6E973